MSYDVRETSRQDSEPFELYLFETRDKSWRLTSADREITHLAEIYEPTEIRRTEMEQGQELKSGLLRISIPKEHQLAAEFISFMPSTPMSLVIYRGHEGDSEVVTIFTGGVSKADFSDFCELECLPESEIVKRRIPGPRYQKQCNHILYDAGCGVDKESFKTTATLTFVDDVTIKATEFDAQTDGWFNSGYIEKGNQRRMILNHVGDTLTLLSPMADLAVDDEVFAFAGCQRDSATCDTKFSNLVNFMGFEWIPNKNPFGQRGIE